MARDWRDDRIAELERENARIPQLERENAELRARIAVLERRISELEARLAQRSGNSSRPPSSDPPGTPPPARPKRTGRRRGGQPGHEKHSRAPVPPERVTRTQVLKPCSCRRCGNPLFGDDPAPYRNAIGRALEVLTETMFHAWHRVRDGTISREDFQKLMKPLRGQVVAWLRDGESCSVRKVAGRCSKILGLEDALWTFVQVEGIEPTNNIAERILRQPVLWRKGSFGTDSPNGSRFVERILTVVTTLRLQKRNVLDYMTAACQAAFDGKAAPSLLPG